MSSSSESSPRIQQELPHVPRGSPKPQRSPFTSPPTSPPANGLPVSPSPHVRSSTARTDSTISSRGTPVISMSAPPRARSKSRQRAISLPGPEKSTSLNPNTDETGGHSPFLKLGQKIKNEIRGRFGRGIVVVGGSHQTVRPTGETSGERVRNVNLKAQKAQKQRKQPKQPEKYKDFGVVYEVAAGHWAD